MIHLTSNPVFTLVQVVDIIYFTFSGIVIRVDKTVIR